MVTISASNFGNFRPIDGPKGSVTTVAPLPFNLNAEWPKKVISITKLIKNWKFTKEYYHRKFYLTRKP